MDVCKIVADFVFFLFVESPSSGKIGLKRYLAIQKVTRENFLFTQAFEYEKRVPRFL